MAEVGDAVFVPDGLEPAPEHGPTALAARIKPQARTGFWIRTFLWWLGAAVVLATGWRVATESLVGFAVLLVVAGYAIAAGVKNLAYARFPDEPILIVDAEWLRVFAPFGKVEVRLSGISWVNAIGHDLLIAAKGAIYRDGQLRNARWATLNNVQALTLTKAELADYLAARSGCG